MEAPAPLSAWLGAGSRFRSCQGNLRRSGRDRVIFSLIPMGNQVNQQGKPQEGGKGSMDLFLPVGGMAQGSAIPGWFTLAVRMHVLMPPAGWDVAGLKWKFRGACGCQVSER